MTPAALPHLLRREVRIRARPETVFRFFEETELFAAWWGAGSSVDPRPGGPVLIRYPNGVEASGEVVSIDPPREIVFTYGYASGDPFGPGASTVRLRLEPEPEGTRLELRHELADPAVRDAHDAGWRFQLALFANRVAERVQERATERIDGWFAAWSEPDAARRRALLEEHVAPAIEFRDAWAALAGLDDLVGHITAARMHQGVGRIVREGAWPFIAVVALDQPETLTRLRDAGALFTVNPLALGSCLTRPATN